MAVASYKNTMQRLLKSPMQKTFTFLGVTLIVIVIFLMGAIRPTLGKISEIRGEIKTRTKVNNEMQEKLNNIEALQKAYEANADDLEVIDLYFPHDMDYSLLLASLEKVTAKRGFDMSSVHIARVGETSRDAKPYTGMEVVEVRLLVEGRRSNLVKLVKHLEELPVLPNMTRVTFSPDEQSEDESWVSATIHMYIYKTV